MAECPTNEIIQLIRDGGVLVFIGLMVTLIGWGFLRLIAMVD